MKLFSALYDKTLEWAKHKYAAYLLPLLSFAESVIFPIPPDVMLAPMCLSQPKKAWFYALSTTIGSLIGGIVGYALGYFLYDVAVLPVIEMFGYQSKLAEMESWFREYGVWIVFLAGFSPIPYKLFTVTAGMMQLAFFPFVIASLVSRGLRFFLVAGLMRLGGEKFQEKLRDWVDVIGWGVVILAIGAYLYTKL
ncbi:YqaA family protein [Algicola sagamiensis]|uniref:YqaA family protein n=1 Tax=Algicola sagamiensis TaxID=163869 RepID=UPI00035D6D64|nr:YqaA family protein [Algicola sagamiensis]